MSQQKRQWYSIVNRAASEPGELLIYGLIGKSWWDDDAVDASSFVREFKALESKHDSINVRINSPGGSIMEGLAICNALKNSTKTVNTYIDGVAASMAFMIALSGTNVYVFPNSLGMAHNASNFVWGNAQDMRDEAEALDKVDKALINDVVVKTGMMEEEVKTAFFNYKDNWLNADEMISYGLVDDKVEGKANVPEGAKNMQLDAIMAYYVNNPLPPVEDPQNVTEKRKRTVNRFSNFLNLLTGNKNSENMSFKAFKQLANALASNTEVSAEMVDEAINEISDAEDCPIVVLSSADPILNREDQAQALSDAQAQLAAVRTAAGLDDEADLTEGITALHTDAEAFRNTGAAKPGSAAKKEDKHDSTTVSREATWKEMDHHKKADAVLGE